MSTQLATKGTTLALSISKTYSTMLTKKKTYLMRYVHWDKQSFSCPYSLEVWSSFFRRTSLYPPFIFEDVVVWLRSVVANKGAKPIIKLVFQGPIYFLWRERNARLHSPVLKLSHIIQKEIKMQIGARLLGLDQEVLKALALPTRGHRSPTSLFGSTCFNLNCGQILTDPTSL